MRAEALPDETWFRLEGRAQRLATQTRQTLPGDPFLLTRYNPVLSD